MNKLSSRLIGVAAASLVVFGGIAVAQDGQGVGGAQGRTGTTDGAQTVPQPNPPANVANPNARSPATTTSPSGSYNTTTSPSNASNTGSTNTPTTYDSGSSVNSSNAMPGPANTGSTGTSYNSGTSSNMSANTDASLEPRTDRN